MWDRGFVHAACAALCLATAPRAPASAPAPATVEMAPSQRAALLASHGEPRLAWEALRAAGDAASDADARLAVRLLTELGRYAQAESLLAGEVAPKSGFAATWHALQRARLLLDAGRPERAIDLLASLDAPPDDPLSAYVDLVRFQAYLRRGDADAAAAAVARASAAGAPEALAVAVDDARVSVLRAHGRSSEAVAVLDGRVARVEDSAERRRLLALRYRVAREADDPAAEARVALPLLEDFRAFAEAETCALDVTRRLRASNDAQGVSTPLLLACAEVFAARQRVDDLRRALRALDARALEGRAGEHLRILWADYHYLAQDYSRALALARPSYADAGFRRRSMLVVARSFRAVDRPLDAAAVYEQFAAAYPNEGLAAEALYTASSLRERARDEAGAARVLDQLRRSYPSTFYGWAAAIRRARRLEAAGRTAEAAEIFEQWLARSRRTDEAALFYLSRLRASTGSPESAGLLLDELRRVNPYSFYVAPDVSAHARGPERAVFARDGGGSLSAWLAGTARERERAYGRVFAAAEGEGHAASGAAEARAALERGRLFLDAGFRDWAARELDVARRQAGRWPDLALLLAKTYEDYAMPWRSVPLFERARVGLAWETRRAHAADFRYLMYPTPYPAHVFDAAARHDLPAHLVYAMIREESRFETAAVSRAGAVGLMQVMPGTARWAAQRMELGADVADRLQDPGVNVSIGTWYANDLLRSGQGRVAWMLAAYNAGPGAAQRWLQPGVEGDQAIAAVERIDYRETRGYVKRVVESANVYQSLYFDPAGAPSAPR